MKIAFRQFYGPSIYATFAAIRAAFRDPGHPTLECSLVLDRCIQLGVDLSWSPYFQARTSISFEQVAGDVARCFQSPEDPTLEMLLVRRDPQRPDCVWLFISYIDSKAAMVALQLGLQVASLAFSDQELNQRERYLPTIAAARKQLKSMAQCSSKGVALRREASKRGIPIYSVASGSDIYQFGQGCLALHCAETITSLDSWTGNLMSANKMHSNQLVASLGFPAVQHFLVASLETALAKATELGYPVVAKPLNCYGAIGVSAWIRNAAELKEAFEKARCHSPRGVIIEKKVEGTVYRLGVLGYELEWAEARYPASVVGNGSCMLRDLIEVENKRREPISRLKEILIDNELLDHIGKQGLELSSIPAKGSVVSLRGTSNYATGGVQQDVLDRVHPENRAMAEAIARAFRLFTVGIDFIIPDISKAWNNVPCAVIEINGNPGFNWESDQASRQLAKRFPGGSNGRIPSVLLVDLPDSLVCLIPNLIDKATKVIGLATEDLAMLRGYPRSSKQASLGNKIEALVLDPSCEAIITATSDVNLLQVGLPLDYFDACLFPGGTPGLLNELLKACCKSAIEYNEDDVSLSSIESLLIDLAILP